MIELKDRPELEEVTDRLVYVAKKYIYSGTLDGELQKVLAFYGEKAADIEKELRDLERELPQLKPGQSIEDDQVQQAALCSGVQQSEQRLQRLRDLAHAPAVGLDVIVLRLMMQADQAAGAQQAAADRPDMQADQAAVRSSLQQIDQRIHKLRDLAQEICHLLGFVSLNMRGLRKSLKKYAKNVEPLKPTPGYLALEIEHPHEPGWKMLQGTFLPAQVAADLDNMQNHPSLQRSGDKLRGMYAKLRAWRAVLLKRSTQDLEDATSAADVDLAQSMEEVLEHMESAKTEARRNASLVHALEWYARRAGIFEPPPPDEKAVATMLGLILNCTSSGLYMANYQLVLPNIRDYLFYIGSGASVAGLVIGCSDVASIPGTVVYSVWTNSSFKAPLIASGIACLAGNFLYCLGYDFQSFWILLLARLITGFGSARTVNRRYIADFTPKAQRTKASAAFVTCSAAGMALGPLLALPLQHFPDLHYLGLSFNPVTMGAWVMSAIWVVFLTITLICFSEPPVRASQIDHSQDSLPDAEQPLLGNRHANGSPVVNERPSSLDKGGHSPASDHGHKHPAQAKTMVPGTPDWKATIQPTLCAIIVLYLLKLVQQAYLDSLPLFTSRLYGWTAGEAGLLLAAFGISVIPVNTIVGYVADYVSDRTVNASALFLTIVACAMCFCAGSPMWLYFSGGLLLFFCTVVLEGTAMSLCSKVMHPSLASGTWNAGLISTEAGTIGRLCGNFLLSVVAKFTGDTSLTQLNHFGQTLFGLLAVITAASLGYMIAIWKRLAC
eukprot:jgi/Astpho2/1311/Aster-06184